MLHSQKIRHAASSTSCAMCKVINVVIQATGDTILARRLSYNQDDTQR